MLVGVVTVSVIALAVVLIATWTGTDDLSTGAWPVIAMTPYFGLPLGMLLLLTLLIVTMTRRARSATASDSRS